VGASGSLPHSSDLAERYSGGRQSIVDATQERQFGGSGFRCIGSLRVATGSAGTGDQRDGAVAKYDGNARALRQLQAIGLRISLDDFGTGYSSISSLRIFPFDKIKIDQSFVRDLDSEREAAAIVHAIVDLGSALGMLVTAEGVETPEQLRMLRAESCQEVQGYLFSKPVSAAEVPALIERMSTATCVAAQVKAGVLGTSGGALR